MFFLTGARSRPLPLRHVSPHYRTTTMAYSLTAARTARPGRYARRKNRSAVRPARSGGSRLMGVVLVAGRRTLVEDLVDEAELLRLAGAEELVAVDRPLDRLERLAGIFRHQRIHVVAHAKDFLRLDLDVASHALGPPRRLVDHDPGVGQRDPHARFAGAEQEGAHR